MRKQMRTIELSKLDALVSENIRLREQVNRVWFKPWLPVALIIATAAAAFAGAAFSAH